MNALHNKDIRRAKRITDISLLDNSKGKAKEELVSMSSRAIA